MAQCIRYKRLRNFAKAFVTVANGLASVANGFVTVTLRINAALLCLRYKHYNIQNQGTELKKYANTLVQCKAQPYKIGMTKAEPLPNKHVANIYINPLLRY